MVWWLLTSLLHLELYARVVAAALPLQALRAAAGGVTLWLLLRALHPAADVRRALRGHFDLDEPFRLLGGLHEGRHLVVCRPGTATQLHSKQQRANGTRSRERTETGGIQISGAAS